MTQAAISSIGIASPAFKRSQLEIAKTMSAILNLSATENKILHKIYTSSGIEQRYSVLNDFTREIGNFEFFPNQVNESFPSTQTRMKFYKMHAFDLAHSAILHCMDSSMYSLQQVTHLITVSCTGLYAPGLDIEIVQQLKLLTSVKRTAIQFMGCYGSFNAIKVADSIVRADQNACVLVVSVELCSLHVQQAFTMENLISNALFADGAGAVLITAPKMNHKGFVLESFFCDLVPQSTQEMSWQISNFGFEMVLTAYVPEMIRLGIKQFMQNLLEQSYLKLSDVNYYAIHPGGTKILQACEQALDLSTEANRFSYEVLRKYGNMSSATILFVLYNLWHHMKESDQDKRIMSCAFGPGLTLESMMLQVINP